MVDGQRLKVFISYSRKDSSDFADELVAGLELAGFAPFIDRHDIAAGEDWEARLGGLIHEADTVVYVVSPEAVKSERCSWEIDKTLALSKRLIPLIFKPVPEIEIPERLRRLQFVRFDAALSVTRQLAELAQALRQDIDWIREHTRIAELAARWQAHGKPSSLLLRGAELDAARAWVGKRKPDAPEITDVQTALLKASIAESRIARRRKILVLTLVGVLIAAMAAVLAAWRYQQALTHYLYWLTDVRSHVLTAEQERVLKTGDAFKECADEKLCPEMIVVPAGSFLMGSPPGKVPNDERPQHQVAFAKPFAVSKFEVTFDQWDTCVAHGDCDPHISASGFGRGRRPVINLSWDDAQRYVAWLSRMTGKHYRLLTEAEWEYAARAGTATPYYYGDPGDGMWPDEAALRQYAWYVVNSDSGPHPVGEKKANSFGLYDMFGNVLEWVEDCFHDSHDGAPEDGSAWTAGDCGRAFRVVRGGSWRSISVNLSSAHRDWRQAETRDDVVGFRVARTLAP